MAPYHKVRQGEHLAGIVARHGLPDFQAVWERPENAELRGLRGSPHVLLPGDRIFLPERSGREEACGTEVRHRFRLRGSALVLRIDTRDLAERPLRSAPYVLRVGRKEHRGTTDAEGRLEARVRPHDEEGLLEIDGALFPLHIGHLDPVDTPTGQLERLRNLGYAEEEDDEAALAEAVEAFQQDHGLPVDGLCGETTRQKLLDEHGC